MYRTNRFALNHGEICVHLGDINTLGIDKEGTFEDTIGPITTIFVFPQNINLPNLLKEVELFDSTSDARRAGYDKSIEIGYSIYYFKHWHIWLHIWKNKS